MKKSIWGESLKILPAVIKKAWIWVIPSMIIEEAFNAWLKSLTQQEGHQDERLFIFCALGGLLLQLLLSAIIIIIVNQIIYDVRRGHNSGVIEGLKKNLKYVFIESTRALLPVILKLLLFIVPGIVEGIRLYFVPYIAQFNANYRAGQVDALEYSRQLVGRSFFKVTGFLILAMIFSIVPRLYLEAISIKQTAYYIVIFLFAMAIDIYGDVLLFLTYEKLEELSGYSISLS